jgi:hypothetical protein
MKKDTEGSHVSDYDSDFHVAGEILINRLISEGYRYITLDQLYKTLGAVTVRNKNGVRWAVRYAKKAHLLKRTNIDTIYKVR